MKITDDIGKLASEIILNLHILLRLSPGYVGESMVTQIAISTSYT